MKFEDLYKSTFDHVVASPETVREVLNMKQKKNRKIRFPALAAAVLLICTLATTAFAYTGFLVYENPRDMMEAFFGGNSSAEGAVIVDEYGQTLVEPSFQREELNESAAAEYVEPFTYEVGQSISVEKNVLTVDGYAYDSNTQCGLVYMSLEMPGGFPEYKVANNGMLVWQGPELVRTPFGIKVFVESAEDTQMKLAGYFYVPDYYAEKEFPLYLYNGQNRKDPHLNIPLENVGNLQSVAAGNSGVQIAPFAVVVNGDKLGILTDTKETNLSYLAVRYDDGSVYVVLDESGDIPVMNYIYGSMERGDKSDGYVSDRYCTTYILDRVLDIKRVVEVVVDDTIYQVD